MESSLIEKIEINVDFIIPEEEKKSFQTIFSFIRKKLQLKLVRKNNIDSLLKKCKGKFFKAVFESIKLCLNLKVERLPQKFITNITIEYNKTFIHTYNTRYIFYKSCINSSSTNILILFKFITKII